MEIQLIHNSSALMGFTYEDGDLTIHFKDGRSVTYLNVPQKTIDELQEAKSAGLYFNLSIRDQFEIEDLRNG